MSDKLTVAKSNTGDRSHTPANDRRDFIKKGALAAPLIASVASRPVWACNVSGELSGNVSNPQGDCALVQGDYITPGTFERWVEVYDFIKANPSLTDENALLAASGPSGNPFVNYTSSIPVFAVFYWKKAKSQYKSLPIDDQIPSMPNIKPTTRAGIANTDFTDFGKAVNAGGNLLNTATAILNASHSDVFFPQSGNEWSPAYIANKESDPAPDALYDTLATLFNNASSYLVTPSNLPSTAFEAYTNARWFLFKV